MNPNSINVLIGSPEKRKQESKTQSEISKSSSQNFDFCSSKTRYSTPVTATADTTMNKSSTNPPPGAAEGGTWGSVHYIGSKTQMFACLGCLCFCIPGLCILACPQVSSVQDLVWFAMMIYTMMQTFVDMILSYCYIILFLSNFRMRKMRMLLSMARWG